MWTSEKKRRLKNENSLARSTHVNCFFPQAARCSNLSPNNGSTTPFHVAAFLKKLAVMFPKKNIFRPSNNAGRIESFSISFRRYCCGLISRSVEQ